MEEMETNAQEEATVSESKTEEPAKEEPKKEEKRENPIIDNIENILKGFPRLTVHFTCNFSYRP